MITSLENPKVKHLIKLRENKRYRDKSQEFFVEGYREVKRLLESDLTVRTIFYCTELWLGENEQALLDIADSKQVNLEPVSKAIFSKISYRDRPDGLIADAITPNWDLGNLPDPSSIKGPAIYLLAQSIEKPGNLGTLLRTADGAGLSGLIIVDKCTDLFNPNVIRASLGTIFSVPVAEADSESALKWLERNGIRSIATTPNTDNIYTETEMLAPVVIIVGSEQYGLNNFWLENADQKVKINMRGSADSLNAAISTAIVLYESLRQNKL